MPACPYCGYPSEPGGCRTCGGDVLDGPLGRPVRPGRLVAPLEVAHGFRELWRTAIHLLTRPEYFGRLKGPVAANAVAFVLLAGLLAGPVYSAASWLASRPEGVLATLREAGSWSPDGLAVALTIATGALLGPALLQTVTMPFLDPLADAVERMTIGPGAAPRRRSRWQDLSVNVRSSAQVLAMQVLLLVPCLLLSFCGFGLVLALLIAAYLDALLWFELPFARRGVPIERRIAVVRRNWPRALGLGLAFVAGMAVPIFNLLLLAPAAAVAATMLYPHLDKGTQA